MVHKTYILPGVSDFVDTAVLAQYPPTSIKRIVAAGAIALYLKQNQNIIDVILSNPIISALGVTRADGLVDLETVRDIYKAEITKAGFLRIHFPILGDVDFTADDVDTLYKCIMSHSPSTTPT